MRKNRLSHSIPVWGACLAFLVLSSCIFRQDENVDFSDLEAAQGMKFRVISRHETDLSNGIPYDCYLPDGTRVADFVQSEQEGMPVQETAGPHKMPQTSSVTGAGILQELLKYGN
jgi:hypothetical protein